MNKICLLLVFVAAAFGCKDTDIDLTNVKNSIERLLPEDEYDVIDGVYRYIANQDREERFNDPIADYGDIVFIEFEARVFSSSITGSAPFWSNKEYVVENLIEQGLTITDENREQWKTDLLEVRLGSTSLTRALDAALPGCREQDSVVVLVPYDRAGGEKTWGILPEKTSIAWLINIERVENQ